MCRQGGVSVQRHSNEQIHDDWHLKLLESTLSPKALNPERYTLSCSTLEPSFLKPLTFQPSTGNSNTATRKPKTLNFKPQAGTRPPSTSRPSAQSLRCRTCCMNLPGIWIEGLGDPV